MKNNISYEQVSKLTKQISVLFVEDDKDFRNETTELFSDIFKSIDVCRDGQEALKKYKKYFDLYGVYYDLVITDIKMPNMDGVALIKNIYTHNPSQHIIVISAHDESNILLELINIGIEQFFVKPLEYNEVLKTLYNSSYKLLFNKEDNQIEDVIHLENNYKWDKKKLQLYFGEEEVKLTKKELLLLDLFIKNETKISTIEEIFYLVWKEEPHLATKESLKSIVSRLRKKLPYNEIENLYGLGYRLIF